MPDPEKEYGVVTNASDMALGIVLLQEGHPIACASKKMIPAELNYSTTEQELLASAFAVQLWRCYLEGSKFRLVTDHCPNTYFKTQPTLSRRQCCAHAAHP